MRQTIEEMGIEKLEQY